VLGALAGWLALRRAGSRYRAVAGAA
jgi:hypothetical protein